MASSQCIFKSKSVIVLKSPVKTIAHFNKHGLSDTSGHVNGSHNLRRYDPIKATAMKKNQSSMGIELMSFALQVRWSSQLNYARSHL